MKAVIQRVSKSKVEINGVLKSEMEEGLLALIAVSADDNLEKIKWFANKLVNLRVFPDDQDKMNKSVTDIGGSLMLISNFTVYGDANKGFRPNFSAAASPLVAERIFNQIVDYFKKNYQIPVYEGEFGAMMDISLTNAGPVTVIVEK
ncbi:MAG TPA: D-aminoacyl-tRNA deacylase [Candidatus Kapabacteria bacterium]|nr:D-aminoacyl-tRNA deacylase [Candidatus Kapabacteria bacterium]HPO62530.1 D-aminoacyl-tRNA deacylase [Candidatus Kapabacteria bacterium]